MRWVLLMALLLCSCAQVKPWERGALAHRSMDPAAGDRICSDDFFNHAYDVREGATGCSGKLGGGCGCN